MTARIRAGVIGRHAAAAGTTYPLHAHREWEFVLYRRGGVVVTQAGATISAVPGTLVVTPPGVMHSDFAVTDYENIHLQIFAPRDTPWPAAVQDDAAGRLSRIVSDLEAEAPQEERMRELLLSELEIVIIRLARKTPAASPMTTLVERAEARLRTRVEQGFSLAELAAELHVSSSTLRAAFRRERDATARDRYAEFRMQRALALLRGSEHTLEQIARLTGFSSASHLSRSVRDVTGLAPGQVRETISRRPSGSPASSSANPARSGATRASTSSGQPRRLAGSA